MQTIPLREYAQQFTRELDKEEVKREIAHKMLARNMSVDLIMDVTGLDEEDMRDIQ